MKVPLKQWINGKACLPQRFIDPTHLDIPSDDWLGWISIEEKDLLHKANSLNWLSLSDSIEQTTEYIKKAAALIQGGLYEGSLDHEDALEIRDVLGDPPIQCCPIYFISVGSGNDERVVYIGKTKNSKRFSGGHSVALKLHDPIYNNLEKKIYRASIWFHLDDYLALDWIKPTSLAEDIFDSIESQLIFDLKPELNTDKKSKNLMKWKFNICISNHLPGGFMHDWQVFR